jgi:hypothetical protein
MHRCCQIPALVAWFAAAVPAQQFGIHSVTVPSHPGVGFVLDFPAGSPFARSAPDKADLYLAIDGRDIRPAREILTFQKSGARLAYVIAVDVSGSMRGAPLDEIKAALPSVFDELYAAGQPGLVSFAQDARTEAAPGAARDALEAAVTRLAVRPGLTALYSGIEYALEVARRAAAPYRRVLVISDGKDETNAEAVDAVSAKARSYGIPVDAVARGSVGSVFGDTLRLIAEHTGGSFSRAGPHETEGRLKLLISAVLNAPVAFFDGSLGSQGTPASRVSLHVRSADLSSTPLLLALQEQPASLLQQLAAIWPYLAIAAALVLGIVLWVVRKGRKKAEGVPGIPPTPPPPQPPPQGAPRRQRTVIDSGGGGPEGAIALSVLSGPLEGRRFDVPPAGLRIGASGDNHVAISGDDYLSSHHAHIEEQQGHYLLYDDHSRNGTFLNGKAVENTPVALKSGDRIRVGRTEIEVQVSGRPARNA